MPELIVICTLAGVGTLLLCLIGYYLFKKFGNPFDSLDEEDITELDNMKQTLIDVTSNLK